jgi:hypothetical protein
MNGDKVPEDHQSDAQPPASASEPQSVTPTPPAPNAAQHLKTAEEDMKERMSAFERSTVRLTQISIGVAIVVGLAVFAQWWEMHTSGVDTHALAEDKRRDW